MTTIENNELLEENQAHKPEAKPEIGQKIESAPQNQVRTAPKAASGKWLPWLLSGSGILVLGMGLVILLIACCGLFFLLKPDANKNPLTPVNAQLGDTWVSPNDGMVLVYVPAGEFLMGSSDSDSKAKANEKPQHSVYLDGYWIDRTEVTNAMFEQFVEATGYRTTAEMADSGWVLDINTDKWNETSGANWQHPRGAQSDLTGLEQHPVVQVSWEDANAYCSWASRRLPTEAEWEKAARGTDGQKYPWGNQAPVGNLANLADASLDMDRADKSIDDSWRFTSPVGSYPDGASPYGALDMAGNVWEWVMDWFGETYYSSTPTNNPTGPTSGEYRVLRSGSWYLDASFIRAAFRVRDLATYSIEITGFRCAR